MLTVDCAEGTCRTGTIPYALLLEGLRVPGGLGSVLAQRHGGTCLAAGPLTGSFAPASGGIAIVSQDGLAAHVPLGHGASLRLCGYDAIVLTGRADEPVVLRCGFGATELVRAPANASGHELRTSLLMATKSGMPSLLVAVPQEEIPAFGAAGLEHGPTAQGRLVSLLLHRHGLSAVALEPEGTLPPIPVPVDNPLREIATKGENGRTNHWAQEIAASSGDPVPAEVTARIAACWHCPSPCLAWIKGDDGWILCADHAGAAAAFAHHGSSAPLFLARCFRLGLDAAVCTPLVPDGLTDEQALRNVIAGSPEPGSPQGLDTADANVAFGFALGLCPTLLRRVPGLTPALAGSLLAPDMEEAFLTSHASKGGTPS
jgi:hypothetical protein